MLGFSTKTVHFLFSPEVFSGILFTFTSTFHLSLAPCCQRCSAQPMQGLRQGQRMSPAITGVGVAWGFLHSLGCAKK